jgi:hypothetical protein
MKYLCLLICLAAVFSQNDLSSATIYSPPLHNTSITVPKFTIIPQPFWVNKQGQPGEDFIILRNLEGNFLGCTDKGEVVAPSQYSTSVLWKPEINSSYNSNIISLRSYWGGILTLDVNNRFTCGSKNYTNFYRFSVFLFDANQRGGQGGVRPGTEVTTIPNNMVLRTEGGKYIGIRQAKVYADSYLSRSDVFEPYRP